jgi:hypothetical protein
MDTSPTQNACPRCGIRDAPLLIVRGTGQVPGDVALQCRGCGNEWLAGTGEPVRAGR